MGTEDFNDRRSKQVPKKNQDEDERPRLDVGSQSLRSRGEWEMKDSRSVRQEAEPCFPIAISHAHPQYKNSVGKS